MITLRPYQEKCTSGVRRAYSGGQKAPLLVSPTGSGKTVMFAYIAQQSDTKGKRVLILAHRKELCTQCGNKLMENQVDFGFIRPKRTPDYSKNVQVGTIQTVVTRMHKMMVYDPAVDAEVLWRPDLIIIDEAHRSIASTYRQILDFYPTARVLGVTATPKRMDGRGLNVIYDKIVMGPTIKELTPRYLLPTKTFGPKIQIDLSAVEVKENGDYHLGQLEEAVDKAVLVGDAVSAYQKICPGAPAVAFCVSIKHSQHVAEQFRAAGYIFEHVDGDMSDTERDAILKRVANGETHGITSVDLVTEGFDAPILQCAIMLRPTSSVSLYLQMAGRVLRKFDGQEWAYILDHAGLVTRHGFVDDERVWSLDGETKRERTAAARQQRGMNGMRQCTECYALHRYGPKCPECGYVYETRTVSQEHGELEELERKEAPAAKVAPADKQMFKRLQEIQEKKGYRADWAQEIYRQLKEEGY